MKRLIAGYRRWLGINVPKGATISNAYIQFGAKESQSEVTNLTIRGEAADNSVTFGTSSNDVTNRVRTSSYASWSPVAWNSTDGQGPNQRTPNLAFPIQQIVNRAGWVSGNALSIIINGTGHRTAWAWDGSAANAPLLHIEYGGSAPPDQVPVAQLSVAEDSPRMRIACLLRSFHPLPRQGRSSVSSGPLPPSAG